MNLAQSKPDWAPDHCPPDVVQLIEEEQFLQDFGLRGLASADSKELRQAVLNLKWQLGEAARQGRRRGLQIGLGLGALCGGLGVGLGVLMYLRFAG